jgi:hypothetical protein
MKKLFIIITTAALSVVGVWLWFSQKNKADIARLQAEKLAIVTSMHDSANAVVQLNRTAFNAYVARYADTLNNLRIKVRNLSRIEHITNTYITTDTTIVLQTGLQPGTYKWEDKTPCLQITGFLQISNDTVRNYIERREWNNTIQVFPYVDKIRWYHFGKKRKAGYPVVTFRGYTIPRVRAAATCGEVNVVIVEATE